MEIRCSEALRQRRAGFADVWMEPASKVPPRVNKMATTPLGFSALIITATPGSDAP